MTTESTPGTRTQGTRQRILAAAAALVSEDVTASLSVRRVAEQAGVSVGSLRHFFPTQQALHEAVMAGIYSVVVSDDGIADRSVPARDRLVNGLRRILAPAGVGVQARQAWIEVTKTFIEAEPTDDVRAAHRALMTEGQRRVEGWLAALVDEGALSAGDNTHRARFLLTVLNGLSIERALPSDESLLRTETQTLLFAVDAVFAAPAA